jgi:hypothetical protein
MFPNLPTKTLGGKFFWRTLAEKNGWRLQQNVLTGHFRILDNENIRQGWGLSEDEIRHTFRKFTGSV